MQFRNGFYWTTNFVFAPLNNGQKQDQNRFTTSTFYLYTWLRNLLRFQGLKKAKVQNVKAAFFKTQ